jgi:segregation and condensation protein B
MASINLLNPKTEKNTKEVFSRSQEITRILEALLFSSSDPLSIDKMREVIGEQFPLAPKELKRFIEELRDDYVQNKRAFCIDEIGGGYVLKTFPELGEYIERLHASRRSEKLSKASMEVLAIIAYRAPITRAEIEEIRGVDSSGTVASLAERGLIESKGRRDTPGRPAEWGPSKLFLKHFGLKSIEDFIHFVAEGS